MIIIHYFVRPLNRDLSTTYFAKALVFCAVAVYFTPRRGVAQPGSASDILIAISMTLDQFNAIGDFNFET